MTKLAAYHGLMVWHLIQSRLVLKDELVEVPHRRAGGFMWNSHGLYMKFNGI